MGARSRIVSGSHCPSFVRAGPAVKSSTEGFYCFPALLTVPVQKPWPCSAATKVECLAWEFLHNLPFGCLQGQLSKSTRNHFIISISMKLLDSQFPHPHRKFKTHLFRPKVRMIMMTTLREMAECQRNKARSQGDQVILSYLTHVSMCPQAEKKNLKEQVISCCSSILLNDAGEAFKKVETNGALNGGCEQVSAWSNVPPSN